MLYRVNEREERIIKTVRTIEIGCDKSEYLNGELDKHIKCALRSRADKIIIEIVDKEYK